MKIAEIFREYALSRVGVACIRMFAWLSICLDIVFSPLANQAHAQTSSSSSSPALIGGQWCPNFSVAVPCSSSPISSCMAAVSALGTMGGGLGATPWVYTGTGAVQLTLPYWATAECYGTNNNFPTPMGLGPVHLRLNPMQCGDGYASQPDGSCAPTRLPVQVCTAGSPVISGVGTTIATDQNNDGNTELPTSFAYRSYSVYGPGNGAGQWTLNWQRSLDVSLASYDVPWVVGLRDDGSAFAFFI